MTIVEFIRARLVEDEVTARAATAGPWRYNPGKEWFTDEDKMRAARAGVPQSGGEEFVGAGPMDSTIGVAATGPAGSTQGMCDADHIARHDPARVLAQVAAMRAILDFHESWPVLVETPPEMVTGTGDTGNVTIRMAKQMAWLTEQEYRKRFGTEPPTAPMLRHLAAIWSDHSDYDLAWSPGA